MLLKIIQKLFFRFERHYIDNEEEAFWLDVIEKYLTPITLNSNEQEVIKMGLIELRNKVIFSFTKFF